MLNILLVEDDLSLAEGIQYALSKEGWEVDMASTVSEASKKLESPSYHMVLLDIMLPDGSGFEICKMIRLQSDIPVIFLTACDEEVNVVMGLDMGGDDYITKPFRIRELVSRIRAIQRRNTVNRQEPEGLIIRSGNICLNIAERKVTKKGNEILLSPTEFKLLHSLMKNPFRVLDRSIILEKLWDINGDFVDDNTLSVYIKRLRDRIEDEPACPMYIVTVRGYGYKWNRECV